MPAVLTVAFGWLAKLGKASPMEQFACSVGKHGMMGKRSILLLEIILQASPDRG